MLKPARDYRLFSRTIIPVVALYTAGLVLGRVVYLASGHLWLLTGPLGELRRAFIETAPPRPYRVGVWMDWASVLVCGRVLFAELGRQHGRKVVDADRVLLVAYLFATMYAVGMAIAPLVPEPLYAGVAILMASLFIKARWSSWSRGVRCTAIGVASFAMGVEVVILRLRDLSSLGQLD